MIKTKGRRSEGRFQKELEKAVDEHARKLGKGRLSLPSGAGKLVVAVSNNFDHRSAASTEEQRLAFHEEADRLAEEHRDRHGEVVIGRKATSFIC